MVSILESPGGVSWDSRKFWDSALHGHRWIRPRTVTVPSSQTRPCRTSGLKGSHCEERSALAMEWWLQRTGWCDGMVGLREMAR